MTVRVIGPKDPREEDAINVTTSGTRLGRYLSPMLLGPVHLYDGIFSQNVENAWQYAKLYPEFADESGEPLDSYWDWAHEGWDAKWANRYPMGKGRKPLCTLWEGERLGYLEARQKVYGPLYGEAVLKTVYWERLKKQYLQRGALTLFDYDGYDYLKLGMTLSDVLNDPTRKMGHAFVLAMMLTG